MVDRIDDMPAGTIGSRASGRLTRNDYREILEPVLHAAESGEIRMLFTLTAFEGLEPTAWFDDIKTGLGLGIGHHSAWKLEALSDSHRRRLGRKSIPAVRLDDPRRSQGLRTGPATSTSTPARLRAPSALGGAVTLVV